MQNICPNCGSDSEDDSIFCEECGYQLKNNPSPPVSQRSNEKVPNQPKKVRFVRQKK